MYRDLDVPGPLHPKNGRVVLSALSKHEYPDEDLDSSRRGESRIVDGFLGSSEEGFIVQNGVCSVPASTVSWDL